MVHIADETKDQPTAVYPLTNLVLRQHWREPESLQKNVITIPCGLRTGWKMNLFLKPVEERCCPWIFYGSMGVTKQRTTGRMAMKATMEKIPGGCTTKTLDSIRGGTEILQLDEFQSRLCDSTFAPCPGGNTNMTFRLVESLELGAGVDRGGWASNFWGRASFTRAVRVA